MWDWRITSHGCELLKTHPSEITSIIIYIEQEFEYTRIYFENALITDTIIDFSNEYNVPIHIISGTSPIAKLYHPDNDPRYKNITIHSWSNYWFGFTWYKISTREIPEQPTKYTYPFISMNGKPYYHRCVMLSALKTRNLLDKAAYSWNPHKDSINCKDYGLPELSLSRWLTEQDGVPKDKSELNKYVDQYRPPLEYYESFSQLITETTNNNFMLTEKTAMALFLTKPFICMSCPGYHIKLLRDFFGLELYTELFDYSFDDEQDFYKRCDLIADQFEIINNMSDVEMHDMYN